MDDPFRAAQSAIRNWFAVFFCGYLLQSVMAQEVVPGHIPITYLGEDCTGVSINGIHKLTIVSQSGSRYGPNTDCALYLNLKGNYVMQFTFEQLHLQTQTNGECMDYIQFFNDHAASKPFSPKLCGKVTPQQPYISNSSQVAVKFVTNGIRQHHGFTIQYSSLRQSKLHTMGCVKGEGASCASQFSQEANSAAPALKLTTTSITITVTSFLLGLVLAGS